MPHGFACTAYGPEPLPFTSPCFVEAVYGPCERLSRCLAVMAMERQRMWNHLNELALAGDEIAIGLLHDFDSPDELLGGRQADEPE
jgi:hypothetical protein